MRCDLFGKELHLIDKLFDAASREVEAEQVRDAGLAQGNGLVHDLPRRADQIDLLMADRTLSFQRGRAQRHQVLVHLAPAEALKRGLPALADMHDELWAHLDGPG